MERAHFVKTPGAASYPNIKRSTVITKNIVTSTPVNDLSDLKYDYREDRWEIEPKTGYTYGESGAYQVRRLGTGCISPNMSRRRLRQDMHNISGHQNTNTMNLDESYLNEQQEHDYPTVPNQINAHPAFLDQDFEEPTPRMLGVHGLRVPASETRSGRKYGGEWEPGHPDLKRSRRRSSRRSTARNATDTDNASEYSDVSSVNKELIYNKMLEKESEYSGQANLMKERELNHLHGLDVSDNESEESERRVRPKRTTWSAPNDELVTPLIYVSDTTSQVFTTHTSSSSTYTMGEKITSDVYEKEKTPQLLDTHTSSSSSYHAGERGSSDVYVREKTPPRFTTHTSNTSSYTMGGSSSSDVNVREKTPPRFTTHTSSTSSYTMGGSSSSDAYLPEKTSQVFTTYTSSPSSSYTESTSLGKKIANALNYPFSLIYSLLIALLYLLRDGFMSLGETVKWLASSAWVDREVERGGATSYSRGSDKYTTTTTTTVTTSEFFSDDEDEEGYDTVDQREKPVYRVRRTRPVAERGESENRESWLRETWLYTVVKTLTTSVVTATTTVLWSPVYAAQVLGGGVKKTTEWFIPQKEDETSATVGDSMSETIDTEEIIEESSVRRRRSKAAHPKQYKISVKRSQREGWFTRWTSYLGHGLGNGIDNLASGVSVLVLWPFTLLSGLGHSLVRSVMWVGGAGLAVRSWLMGGQAPIDEDKDIDTTVTTTESWSTRVLYSRHTGSHEVSTSNESWCHRASRAVLRALFLPVYIILALMRWLWWGLGAPFRWLRTAGVGGAVADKLEQTGNRLHRNVANLVVWDVGLLSRTSVLNRRYGCCCLIPFLILLPLLLTGAYYVYDRSKFVSLLATVEEPAIIKQAGVGVSYTDSDLDARIRVIVASMLSQQKAAEPVPPVVAAGVGTASDKSEAIIIQQYKQEMQTLITNYINEKYGSLDLKLKEHGDSVSQQAAFATNQNSDLKNLQAEMGALVARINELNFQIGEARAKMNSEDEEVRRAGAAAIAALEKKLEAYQLALKDCCKTDSALALLVRKGVEEHLGLMMSDSKDGGDKERSFLAWLQTHFVKREDVDQRLDELLVKIDRDIKEVSNEAAKAAALAAALAASKESSTSTKTDTTVIVGAAGGIDEEHVKTLIQNALLLYGADKTGRVDYALESAGGSVINTRCSETYYRRTAQLSLFGIPLWYTSNSARTVIQPDMQPGQCWAFRGGTGFVVIQLASSIYPTSFTMEHIPKSLSPSGTIDSAPKDFSVLGLEYDQDKDGTLLGNFTYLDNGEPLQTFYTDRRVRAYPVVELRIHNNHGNDEYTCLYRFRVHGDLE